MGGETGVERIRPDGKHLVEGGAVVIWDVLEALALVAVVVGLYLLFGAWGLIGGGLAVLLLSLLVNRPKGGGE